jgi:hypothetical protein
VHEQLAQIEDLGLETVRAAGKDAERTQRVEDSPTGLDALNGLANSARDFTELDVCRVEDGLGFRPHRDADRGQLVDGDAVEELSM